MDSEMLDSDRRFEYDPQGRVVPSAQTNVASGLVEVSYDMTYGDDGQVSSILRTGRGSPLSWAYTREGNVITGVAVRSQRKFTLDDDGRITEYQRIDPRGTVTERQVWRWQDGRLTTIEHVHGNGNLSGETTLDYDCSE